MAEELPKQENPIKAVSKDFGFKKYLRKVYLKEVIEKKEKKLPGRIARNKNGSKEKL